MSWSLGGCPSPNLLVAQRFARDPDADPERVLDEIAASRYGVDQVPKVRAAWRAFSKAFSEYPYDGAGALPRPPAVRAGESALRQADGIQGDHGRLSLRRPGGLVRALSSGSPRRSVCRVAAAGRKASELWDQSTDRPRGRSPADPRGRSAFRSSANQVRFILRATDSRRDEMIRLLDAEAELAAELLPLTLEDSRIGFESSNQYYYTPLDLVEKVINCEYLKSVLAGRPR